MNDEAQAVLDYWLRELPREKRFAKDEAVDTEIRERFGALHARLSQAVPAEWTDSPRALLAGVIVLDQFSRNLFRGDPRAYAQDKAALDLSKLAIERGDDAGMSREELQFLYMPFMHSEEAAEQDRCVKLFETVGDPEAFDFARRHRDVIARFGRFPQRNEPLGRTSTSEEVAFMEQPGSTF